MFSENENESSAQLSFTVSNKEQFWYYNESELIVKKLHWEQASLKLWVSFAWKIESIIYIRTIRQVVAWDMIVALICMSKRDEKNIGWEKSSPKV